MIFPGSQRLTFFVQEFSKDQWHVESDDHCEYMLCGKFISENAPYVRIRTSQPSRSLGCGDCWIILRKNDG